MGIDQAYFIKTPTPFRREYSTFDPAPMFRRRFTLPPDIRSAKLEVCGLGYGYWYLNGSPVSADLFTAPISDYRKTLWYTAYDVTALLQTGENVLCAMLGNGYYNEALDSPWDLKDASWRDQPKLTACLKVECQGETVVVTSDTKWKCSHDGPVTYHQLHNGEYYDARRFDPAWTGVAYDDSAWEQAVADDTPPEGVLRECRCEPIREAEVFPCCGVKKTDRNTWIFDIGQNISGYIRLRIRQNKGDEIIIRYAEQINDDLTLQLNHMEEFYPNSAFETDRFICSGGEDCWSPRFTYHGFRYVELEGLREKPSPRMVSGVFVHQMVEELGHFDCSDAFLNRIYRLGKLSTLSNLFYMPTDCPTREKLGWTNDAQASANQMLMNFRVEHLFTKWMTDILDAMKENGALPGIVPSSGWGYEHGPVADGILFELPLKVFLFTGDDSLLHRARPAFRLHLNYLRGRADKEGFVGFGLADWAGPFPDLSASPTPVDFVGTVFFMRFLQIAATAARICDDHGEESALEQERSALLEKFRARYLRADGTCTVHQQTAVSLIIHHRLYLDLEPLKEQLLQTVQEHDYHHYCGMVGLRHLYYALDFCGLQDVALRIITAQGYPSYGKWIEEGATTLWETWQPYNSKNHHMYSDVLYWMMKSLAGISPSQETPGFRTVRIAPYISHELDWCEGSRVTDYGTISCRWEKEEAPGCAALQLLVPEGVTADISLPNAVFEGGESQKMLAGNGELMIYHLTVKP